MLKLLAAGLGVKLVLAVGTQHQVDGKLEEQGIEPIYVGGYRVFPSLQMLVCKQRACGKLYRQ